MLKELKGYDMKKKLHTETTGTVTRVFVYGRVVGTVVRVRNYPGLLPREVYEANSRERNVVQQRRSTLDEAVAAITGL